METNIERDASLSLSANVALKSILIGSWFRLHEEEKQKDFEFALSLAKSHPTLFQVGQEFEGLLEAIRDVFRPGKTRFVLLNNQN